MLFPWNHFPLPGDSIKGTPSCVNDLLTTHLFTTRFSLFQYLVRISEALLFALERLSRLQMVFAWDSDGTSTLRSPSLRSFTMDFLIRRRSTGPSIPEMRVWEVASCETPQRQIFQASPTCQSPRDATYHFPTRFEIPEYSSVELMENQDGELSITGKGSNQCLPSYLTDRVHQSFGQHSFTNYAPCIYYSSLCSPYNWMYFSGESVSRIHFSLFPGKCWNWNQTSRILVQENQASSATGFSRQFT